MLKIRLQRTGRKNDPHFRLIVTESTLKPKTSQFAEIVGTYNVKAGIFEAKALPSMGDVVIPVRWVYTGEMTAAQFTSMVMSWNNTDAFQLRFTATTTPANKIELELFPLPVQP